MLSAVDQIGRAIALKPFDVGGWTEEEARAQFVAFRFAATEGRPACVKCGSDAVQHYKCRPIYKCKGCDKQFSATSETPWQRRKISFRKLMYLISCIVHNVQAKSALSISDDIGVQYKTALLWVHKLRAAMAAHAAKATLSGEVEIDGAYFGGYIRPKNQMKMRKDLRKIHYRLNETTLCVVVARERGGPIRTWVTKDEGDARPFLLNAIERGSVVFADEKAEWNTLRRKFKLFQVNHKQAYSTPEACTNQAESVWALMRVLGRVHRSIARNYLDLYAAEAAWTLGKGKKVKGEAFAELMGWMSELGRSSLAGYFQGRKRDLPICKVDGTVEGWKPKPRKGAVAFIDKNGHSVEFKPRRPLTKTWREGFEFVGVRDFLSNPSIVPDHGGVYLVLLPGGQDMLTRTGFVEDPSCPMWPQSAGDHVYTGETYGLRSRLLDHFNGNILKSNLRETLLAIQWGTEAFQGGMRVSATRRETEANLTEWLRSNATIGYRSCSYVRDVEAAILQGTASPLNLKRANPTAYTANIQSLRSRFRQEVVGSWEPPETKAAKQVRR